MTHPIRSQHFRWTPHVCALYLLSVACSDGTLGSGGDPSGGGADAAFPPACPGFESEPGAGCPAPCEPLVSGGPGGRAYCTTRCEDCPPGQVCAFSKGPEATLRDTPDVCLPGGCDPGTITSCPDDMSCLVLGGSYCYPSPGTVGTRCEVYAVVEDEPCSAECPSRLELSGGTLCTMECVAQNQPCAAGFLCFDADVEDDVPGHCSPPCSVDSDCPFGLRCTTNTGCASPPCPEPAACDFLSSP